MLHRRTSLHSCPKLLSCEDSPQTLWIGQSRLEKRHLAAPKSVRGGRGAQNKLLFGQQPCSIGHFTAPCNDVPAELLYRCSKFAESRPWADCFQGKWMFEVVGSCPVASRMLAVTAFHVSPVGPAVLFSPVCIGCD